MYAGYCNSVNDYGGYGSVRLQYGNGYCSCVNDYGHFRRAETLDACVSRVVAEAAAGRARLPSLDVHLELMRVAVDRTR